MVKKRNMIHKTVFKRERKKNKIISKSEDLIRIFVITLRNNV